MTRRPRLLLADDHPLFLEGVRRLLETKYEVVGTVADGNALVDAAKDLRPDVIVVDISMPEMNGLDAAREIRRRSPNIPILMVTLHMSPQLEHQARKVGIRGACDKNDVGCVVEAVETLLHQGTYYRHWH